MLFAKGDQGHGKELLSKDISTPQTVGADENGHTEKSEADSLESFDFIDSESLMWRKVSCF
jgi:hypothetical protein